MLTLDSPAIVQSESDAVKATATVPAGDVKDVGTPSSAAASSKAASPEKEPEKDAGTEEEPSAAAPGASSKPVVDMEVFEQLLEIVRHRIFFSLGHTGDGLDKLAQAL